MCISWLLLIMLLSMHGSTMKLNYETMVSIILLCYETAVVYVVRR